MNRGTAVDVQRVGRGVQGLHFGGQPLYRSEKEITGYDLLEPLDRSERETAGYEPLAHLPKLARLVVRLIPSSGLIDFEIRGLVTCSLSVAPVVSLSPRADRLGDHGLL